MARKNTFSAKSLENCENSCLTYLNGSCAISVGDESESDTSFDDHDTDDSEIDSNEGDVHSNSSESEGPLWLGFLKNPKKKSSLCRHSFPNKAGGTPAWLDPIHLPTGKSFLCDFCEEPLQFVLQVNAPIIGSEFAHHRTIFVFMCLSMACLRDQHEQKMKTTKAVSRSVKVFRCQLPFKNPFYECKNDYDDGCLNKSKLEAPLCTWCSTWKGDKPCTGCRRVRYCSKTHQLNHWQCHKVDCIQMSNSYLHNGDSASVKTERAASNSIWPEYKIYLECRGLKAESSECKDAGDSLILEGFNDDDKKKSLASFQKHILEDPAQVLRNGSKGG